MDKALRGDAIPGPRQYREYNQGYIYRKFIRGFYHSAIRDYIIQRFVDYVKKYNLKSAVLGISGGIDSTLCAYLINCCKPELPRDFKLIGRSYPIKNSQEENSAADLVGKAFCDDFETHSLLEDFKALVKSTNKETHDYLKETTQEHLIREGNIQARLRMIHLYNLSQAHRGIVIDTDNMTEHNLGFFTIHGDVGDLNPIGFLWKNEIFEFVRAECNELKGYLSNLKGEYDPNNGNYSTEAINAISEKISEAEKNERIAELELAVKAFEASLALIPTDGLGITSSDLEQIGARSYADVDDILFNLTEYAMNPEAAVGWDEIINSLCKKYTTDVVMAVFKRWQGSMYKRGEHPIRFHREDFLKDNEYLQEEIRVRPCEFHH